MKLTKTSAAACELSPAAIGMHTKHRRPRLRRERHPAEKDGHRSRAHLFRKPSSIKEKVMKYRTRMFQAVVLGLLASAGYTSTSRAETGAVRVVFTKAGFVVGVGSGRGVLTFRGRNYPFRVSGASLGATIGASTS